MAEWEDGTDAVPVEQQGIRNVQDDDNSLNFLESDFRALGAGVGRKRMPAVEFVEEGSYWDVPSTSLAAGGFAARIGNGGGSDGGYEEDQNNSYHGEVQNGGYRREGEAEAAGGAGGGIFGLDEDKSDDGGWKADGGNFKPNDYFEDNRKSRNGGNSYVKNRFGDNRVSNFADRNGGGDRNRRERNENGGDGFRGDRNAHKGSHYNNKNGNFDRNNYTNGNRNNNNDDYKNRNYNGGRNFGRNDDRYDGGNNRYNTHEENYQNGNRSHDHGQGDRYGNSRGNSYNNGGDDGYKTRNRQDGYNNYGHDGSNANRRNGYGGETENRGGYKKNFDNEERGGYKKNFDNEERGDGKKREFYIPIEPSTDEKDVFSNGISTGINFAKYDSIPIKVTGNSAPEQIEKFEDLDLRDIVIENIKKSNYPKPTPIQKVAMPILLAGRDLMACAQTGSGKTAAYLVPIIDYLLKNSVEVRIGKPMVLVLSPTRELAIQIYTEAKKFSHSSYLRTSLIYGGTSSKHQSENISKGCHILIATPGRLIDFVEKDIVSFEKIAFVVLDEADRMLDMGFKDSIQKILKHPSMPIGKEKPVCCMFSATFPFEIQKLAGEYLNDYIFACIGVVGGACEDVEQTIYMLPKMKKRNYLMELLQEEPEGTIVFVETKRGTDFLASFLSEKDIPSTSIHGDRLQSQRESALKDFRTGKMKILIATNVAARGLDIKNVRHVINYDLPDSIDEYVHRIGRTGRLGNNGRATSFFDPVRDAHFAPQLIKVLQGAKQEVPEFLLEYASAVPIPTSGGGSTFGGKDIRGRNYGKEKDDENQDSLEPRAQADEECWD